MKEDKILIAGIIGAVSTIPSEILTWIGKLLGLANYSDYQLSSLIVTVNRPSMPLGFVVQASIGALVSLVLYRVLINWGKEHVLIKATMSGIIAWLALEIIITAITEGKTIPLREMSAYYIHLLGAVVFGLTQGLLFKRYVLMKDHTQAHLR